MPRLDTPRVDTIGAAFLAAVAAAVLVALVPAAAADSGVPAPLKQMAAGAEAGDILCNSGRVLMISPGGTPACAFPGSADALVRRGWAGVPAGGDGSWQGPGAEQGGHDSSAPASGHPEPRHAGQDRAAPAPHPAEIHDDALAISGRTGGGVAAEPARPHAHHNTLTISKYPVVGEVADVTFTVTVAHDSGYSFGEDFPLARLMTGIGISGYARPDSSFDMVSNIGTGDPGVFRPYDPDNVTTVARPGETYTVKAKFSVPEEEVVKVYGLGLHGDIAEIYIAASKNRSMLLDEYEATGQTYLDHMMAAGHEEPPSLPEYDIDLTVPHWPVNRTTLLGEYHAMYSSFAEGYVSLGYTEDQIVEELFFFGHLRSDIREFFVHIMNYTEEQAGAVRMGDDLLGFAYMASPAGIDDVVHDMLTRRNYTAAEARDLLRDHMFYTDDEAAALVLNAAATRAQAGAAGQQQQQQQPRPAHFAVSGKVHGTTYGGTQAMPVHGIRVCAYDHDATTMRETLLRTSSSGQACTVTAQSGTYAIVEIRNDDPDDDTTVDLLVRVLSEGSRLSVAGTSGASYRHDEPVVSNFNGAMLDRDVTLSGPSAGAGRIIDAISDGRRFFEGHSIGVAPLTVKWQHDAGAGAFSDRSSDSAAYGRSGNIIWLNGNGMTTEDDSHERWTLLHEFGHHVMDATGRFPAGAGCPSPHHLHNQSGAGCAWTEGWADFVPHMVDNSANLRWTDYVYVDLEQDRTENGTGEARNAFARTGPTGGEGHLVEGQVAAALWDVKDSRVDTKFDKEGHNPRGRTLDDLAMGDDEIVDTLQAATYASFEGFYDAWESARAQAHSARNVMDLHAMGFAGGARPLADPFGGLDRWAGSGTLNWSSGAPLEGEQPPGHPAGNTVARARHCAAECVLTLRDGVDLSGFGAAELSLWRFVDNYLGSGDYLRVDVSPDGGSSWSAVRTWGPGSGNDDRWHHEAIPLAPYLNSTDFKVRLSARLSYQTSDAAVDDVVINGTARARAGGPVDVLSSGFDASLEGWAYRQVPAEGNNRSTWKCAPVAAGGAAGAAEGRPGAVGILTRGSHFCD